MNVLVVVSMHVVIPLLDKLRQSFSSGKSLVSIEMSYKVTDKFG